MLVTTCCLFYSLVLFDTLGDQVGFQRAVWVLIVVPMLPLVLHTAWWFYVEHFMYNRQLIGVTRQHEDTAIELKDLNSKPSIFNTIHDSA